MSGVVALAAAHDVSLYGSKAVGLGEAARAGLPLPPGVALSGAIVEAPDGNVFFKCVGPSATIQKAQPEIDELLKSVTKAGASKA